MPAKSAADDEAEIEILKRIGGEITGAKDKEPVVEVVVVVVSAARGIGAGGLPGCRPDAASKAAHDQTEKDRKKRMGMRWVRGESLLT